MRRILLLTIALPLGGCIYYAPRPYPYYPYHYPPPPPRYGYAPQAQPYETPQPYAQAPPPQGDYYPPGDYHPPGSVQSDPLPPPSAQGSDNGPINLNPPHQP
jgi:hypothetical protein